MRERTQLENSLAEIHGLESGLADNLELLELADQSSRRLFAYTRDPRMKSALLRVGYTPARSPGFRPSLNLMVTRPAIFLWMILTLDVKRLIHMSRHMFAYKLYVHR